MGSIVRSLCIFAVILVTASVATLGRAADELGEPGNESSMVTTTDAEDSSTTTLAVDIERRFLISMHPTAALGFLAIEITWTTTIDEIHCNSMVDPASYTVDHEYEPQFKSTITLNYGADGLRQSGRILSCTGIILQTNDADGQPHVDILQANGVDGEPLDGVQQACVDCRAIHENPSWDPDWADSSNEYDNCGSNLCGDANANISYSAADALRVLQSSVGSGDCAVERCDVDRSGNIAAGDALAVLKRAVGLPGTLLCDPPPGSTCFLSTAHAG
ncbi:MAG: hypothetical protein ABR587_16605 [Candidatus Binatia bacterium]